MLSDQVVPRIQIVPGYSIPRVIIRAWQLSGGHTETQIDREQTFSTFDRLLELGMNTFDCADIYTGVEELLGDYLRRRRDCYGEAGIENIQIHTKFVPNLGQLEKLTAADVERIIDRSRERLGIDRLHMVQFAWWNYRVPGYVETAQWLAELQQRGKIQLVGATNFDQLRLGEIVRSGARISLHQVQYSVLDQRPGKEMTELAREHGIWLACYGALAGGFLTDRYLGAPEPGEPFENRSLRKYKLIIDEFGGWVSFQNCLQALASIAQKHSVGIANIASAFVLDRQRVASVIVGTRSDRHIASALATFHVQLDKEDRQGLHDATANAAGPAGNVFELERDREGPHGKIMKYDLN